VEILFSNVPGRQDLGLDSKQALRTSENCASTLLTSCCSTGNSMASLASQQQKYVLIKAEVTDLMSQTGNFLADLTAEPSEVLGQHLNKSFEAYSSSKKKLENETIDCALMALTKSGEFQSSARPL